MSDTTVNPSDSVSQTSQSRSGSIGNGRTPQKKTNKIKSDARSKFNSSAPSISAEKFFSEFVEQKRNNVEIVFDRSVQNRIAEPYVMKARNHAVNKNHVAADNVDLQCSTYALTSLALCRKMLMSVPDSEEYELGKFRNIVQTELMAPKSVIAAVANVGKFELDDKVARIKYNSQDIFRMLIRMCKVMNGHSDFSERYSSGYTVGGETVAWSEVDLTKIVITSESSVRWMRDEGVKFLEQAYLTTWKAQFTPPSTPADPEPAPILMDVSYPRLSINPNPEKQIDNVVAWLGKLHAKMPGVNFVIAAGFATAWRLLFFQRVGHLFSKLVKKIPDWITSRPFDVLTSLGLHHYDISTDDYDGTSYIGFIMEIHRHVLLSTSEYAEFIDLAKQPEDKFGTSAQLLPFKNSDFVTDVMVGLEDQSYRKLKSDAQSVSIVKLRDKGNVVAGLSFGFSLDVQFVPNYIGRLNGDPNNIRTQFLKPDLKTYN